MPSPISTKTPERIAEMETKEEMRRLFYALVFLTEKHEQDWTDPDRVYFEANFTILLHGGNKLRVSKIGLSKPPYRIENYSSLVSLRLGTDVNHVTWVYLSPDAVLDVERDGKRWDGEFSVKEGF